MKFYTIYPGIEQVLQKLLFYAITFVLISFYIAYIVAANHETTIKQEVTGEFVVESYGRSKSKFSNTGNIRFKPVNGNELMIAEMSHWVTKIDTQRPFRGTYVFDSFTIYSARPVFIWVEQGGHTFLEKSAGLARLDNMDSWEESLFSWSLLSLISVVVIYLGLIFKSVLAIR